MLPLGSFALIAGTSQSVTYSGAITPGARTSMYGSGEARGQLQASAMPPVQEQPNSVLAEEVVGGNGQSERESALSLLTTDFAADKRNADALIALLDDPDPDVRFEAARFLPYLWRVDLVTALIRACRRDGTDPRFAEILMDASRNVSRPVLLALANDATFRTMQGNGPLLHTLAKFAMMSEEPDFAGFAATVLDSLPEDATEARKHIVYGFATGAIDNRRKNTVRRIAQSRGLVRDTIAHILTEARAAAADSSLTSDTRVEAIGLLGFGSFANVGEFLVGLLTPAEALDIQVSAVRTLSSIGNRHAVPLLLNTWSSLAPQIRWKTMDAMTRDGVWTLALLDAVESGAITIESLMHWGFPDLLRNPNIVIRNRAKDLLSKYEYPSTDVVADTYQRFRLLQPSLVEGRTLFEDNCAKCHQFDGAGTIVGPSLDFMANAGSYALLKSILLPNLDVNPVYYSYTVETQDFETFTGIVAIEEADTLVILGPSAETHSVAREDISSVLSSEQTLMPGGWGESLGDQGLADLIGYMVDVAHTAMKEQRATQRVTRK
jgi:putative heme-binding domain-containing protein